MHIYQIDEHMITITDRTEAAFAQTMGYELSEDNVAINTYIILNNECNISDDARLSVFVNNRIMEHLSGVSWISQEEIYRMLNQI